MKLKYIIGVLALLLLMVGTASAETFYLTDVNEEEFAGKIKIQVSCVGDTITVQDVSNDLDVVSNVDLKEIGIQLPEGYNVESIVDEGAPTNSWSPSYGSYEESEFGHFNTQINKDPGSNSKTRGPIKIKLNKQLEGSLPVNEYDNSIVIHISFGEKGEALVGSTWVSGYTPIPEFASIAVPVAAIIGILFIFSSKKKE